MSVIIGKNELIDGLKRFFDNIKETPVLIHSDILKIGIVDKTKSRIDICEDYLTALEQVGGNRSLLFPTFNYDFFRDGIYDRQKSPGQVGTLGEYVSTTYSNWRTRTPVFNFCIFDHDTIPLQEVSNPFGEKSTFAEMHGQNGNIAFLGAGFETNTFMHYIEEACGIGYRYIKPYPGKIVDNDADTNIVLQYRVRPLLDHAAEYDWKRLIEDLKTREILHTIPVGNGNLHYCNSTVLYDYWRERIDDEEFFLLTEQSRRVAERLYNKYGRPLTFEKVEGK